KQGLRDSRLQVLLQCLAQVVRWWFGQSRHGRLRYARGYPRERQNPSRRRHKIRRSPYVERPPIADLTVATGYEALGAAWWGGVFSAGSLWMAGVRGSVAVSSAAGAGGEALSLAAGSDLSCLRVRGTGASLFGGSQPGARFTNMEIIRPSMTGGRSSTAIPFSSAVTRSNTARPSSGWAISRPRKMTLTLTLSPSARNSSILRTLTSRSALSVRGFIRISLSSMVF